MSHLKSSLPGKQAPDKKNQPSTCIGCGENHHRSLCHFKSAICWRYGKKGHLAKVGQSSLQETNPPFNPHLVRKFKRALARLREDCFTIFQEDNHPAVSISHASTGSSKKIYLTIKRFPEGVPWRWTQALLNLAWHTLQKLVPSLTRSYLDACYTRLHDYQGNNIPILGHAHFRVEKGNFSGCLPLIIVKGNLPSFGSQHHWHPHYHRR